MASKLGKIGLFGKKGKRAEEHDDDEEAKAAAEAEAEEEGKAKAAEEDDEDDDPDPDAEEHEDDDEEEEESAKSATSARARHRAAKAAKAGAAKFKATAATITDICAIAGKPELAGEFIAAGASQAAVRERLLEIRAEAGGAGEIAGQTAPNGSPGAAAAMWDKAIEKNAKAFGLRAE